VKGFVTGDLIIDKSSIVSVSEERIVVEDLILSEPSKSMVAQGGIAS